MSIQPPSLSVVIPAYNEAQSIAGVVEDLRTHLPEAELIVVNDCSEDATPENALRDPHVKLVSHDYNQGYGASLRNGILHARGDMIAWFDADSEHRAEDLLRMVHRLEQERLGAVLGERAASVSPLRKYGKFLIRVLAVLLGLGYVRDFNCGLRVFRRDALYRLLFLLPTGYSASTTSTFLVIRSLVPFAFEPISLAPRIGQSKVRMRDGYRALLTVLRTASLLQPLRVFGVAAAAMGAVGFVYSLVVLVVNQQGIPALGVLLMVGAFILIALAILADQISLLRMQHSTALAHRLLNPQCATPSESEPRSATLAAGPSESQRAEQEPR